MTTPYVTNGNIGVNLASIFHPSTTLYPYTGGDLPNFPVGQNVTANNNSVWVRVVVGVGGVAAAGSVCTFNSAFTAVMMSNSVGALGDKIGIPAITTAAVAGDFIWLQVYGTCDAISVLTLCAANAVLASTATAGSLDDASGGGTKNISGIVITTTNAGGTTVTEPGELNYPVIGTTN